MHSSRWATATPVNSQYQSDEVHSSAENSNSSAMPNRIKTGTFLEASKWSNDVFLRNSLPLQARAPMPLENRDENKTAVRARADTHTSDIHQTPASNEGIVDPANTMGSKIAMSSEASMATKRHQHTASGESFRQLSAAFENLKVSPGSNITASKPQTSLPQAPASQEPVQTASAPQVTVPQPSSSQTCMPTGPDPKAVVSQTQTGESEVVQPKDVKASKVGIIKQPQITLAHAEWIIGDASLRTTAKPRPGKRADSVSLNSTSERSFDSRSKTSVKKTKNSDAISPMPRKESRGRKQVGPQSPAVTRNGFKYDSPSRAGDARREADKEASRSTSHHASKVPPSRGVSGRRAGGNRSKSAATETPLALRLNDEEWDNLFKKPREARQFAPQSSNSEASAGQMAAASRARSNAEDKAVRRDTTAWFELSKKNQSKLVEAVPSTGLLAMTAADAQKPENKDFLFTGWKAPKARSRQPIPHRRVILSNLLPNWTVRDVVAVVYGGQLEKIDFKPNETSAVVTFVSPYDSLRYDEESAGGIEFDNRMIRVSLDQENVEPTSPMVREWVDNGITRCVVATGPKDDLSIGALKRLAKEEDRHVEHNSVGTNLEGQREMKWRFCSIEDSHSFLQKLKADAEWRNCTIACYPDPCASAKGIHN